MFFINQRQIFLQRNEENLRHYHDFLNKKLHILNTKYETCEIKSYIWCHNFSGWGIFTPSKILLYQPIYFAINNIKIVFRIKTLFWNVSFPKFPEKAFWSWSWKLVGGVAWREQRDHRRPRAKFHYRVFQKYTVPPHLRQAQFSV